ncbi:protein DpdD [Phenylobacterium sp.]|uniref:protein DpdD n=1 Tax=Phenylobacterium sp. TaxID=1871053 RepID=UPI00356A47C8
MALTLDLAAFGAAADWAALPAGAGDLAATLSQESFPGGLLPARQADGGFCVYAVAGSPSEWRKLQPLLLAFSGPTLTDFHGVPLSVPTADPLAQILFASGASAVARLRPGLEPQSDLAVIRALSRLQTLLATAPVLTLSRPEPTSRLLGGLQDALNGGDVADAWRIHGRLRSELRLDAINLTQLEMQILAVAGDWTAIRWHDRFESLALSGPSPATAEVLLEAIYWCAAFDPEDGRERTPDELADDEAFPFVASLLARAPNPAADAVERLRVLVSNAAPAPEAPAAVQADVAPARAPDAAPAPQDPLQRAQTAFLVVASSPAEGDPDADAALQDAMRALDLPAQGRLLERPMFRALWEEVRARAGDIAPPQDWAAWLTRLGDETFDALESARLGATAWRLPAGAADPAAAFRLADQIANIPEGLAEERLGEAMPFLVQWAQGDPQWPREAYRSVYLALLVRMAFAARRGDALLRSTSALLDGALRSGLSSADYRDALDAAETVCVEAVSRASAYDVLDVVDTARAVSPVDAARLQNFTVNVVSVLQGLAARLSDGQRVALAALAEDAGLVAESGAQAAPDVTAIAQVLGGKTVGIYTLTEPAARQAQALLTRAAPNVSVDLNHDRGGSAALAAMASRSDLVVVVWASAKHAATEFLKGKRGERPLVYAAGKGASSIVRAVEEWAETALAAVQA